jgi:hypothetical protein
MKNGSKGNSENYLIDPLYRLDQTVLLDEKLGSDSKATDSKRNYE